MNADLLARYDQRVPRYTSYPTAPHFSPAVNASTYKAWLAALPAGAETSLYLHVPFCAELCLYCGCHTTVSRRYAPVAAYVDLLKHEIDLVAEALSGPLAVRRIHWGGGTPTILSEADFQGLSARLRGRFELSDEVETAVEIDPRTVTQDMVEVLAESGVGRVSLGVQTFDDLVQRTINRIQPFAQVKRVVEWLRSAGIDAINFDLMYGLPYQTVENVLDTVARALSLAPDRIALFGYAHVPWMKKHQALLPADVLPGPAERVAQFEGAAQRIIEAGYVAIGLDHFARPDDPLAVSLAEGGLRRNFQGYTTDDAPVLIGFGTSAIGSLPQGYVQNASSTVEYRNAIAGGRLATARGIELTADDRLRRSVIERLMCDLAVDLDDVCRQHGVRAGRFETELARLKALAADGLAEIEGTRITVPARARALVRAVCAVFDARLAPNETRHAPTV
jgi:oxygen-independent coproporphyrinogen-3 oxidase